MGYETFFTNSVVSSSNLSYSATVKPRDHKPDNIGMKKSIVPPTKLVFTVIELTILQQILQIST